MLRFRLHERLMSALLVRRLFHRLQGHDMLLRERKRVRDE
jgi:hypothetical protein